MPSLFGRHDQYWVTCWFWPNSALSAQHRQPGAIFRAGPVPRLPTQSIQVSLMWCRRLLWLRAEQFRDRTPRWQRRAANAAVNLGWDNIRTSPEKIPLYVSPCLVYTRQKTGIYQKPGKHAVSRSSKVRMGQFCRSGTLVNRGCGDTRTNCRPAEHLGQNDRTAPRRCFDFSKRWPCAFQTQHS